MKPLYKLNQQRLDRLQLRDLSHAHSSNPREGIIQFHFLLLHQFFLVALRATNTRIHLFTSIFWEKSELHLPTIAEVRFSIFNYKSDNIGHPTIQTGQVWPLRWFLMWLCIFLKNKKL